ncbi:MAG: T9SS type A sorting domain-containing protein [bacterium]|nr:T9SS type A sorting domain-containing protein [bacterium]
MKKLIVGLLLLFAGISIARIRYVPQEFPTITIAVSTSFPFDTVLITNGIYTDTLSFSIPITIASNYLLTNDSTDIANTVWQVEHPRYAIYYRQGILRLVGITFQAIGPAVPERGVLHADTSRVKIDNCRFFGEFLIVTPQNATILCWGTGDLEINDIRVVNDPGSTFFIWAQAVRWLSLSRCIVQGGGVSDLIHSIYAVSDSLQVLDCSFENRKRVLWFGTIHKYTIEKNSFVGVGPDGFRFLANNAILQSTVKDCYFSGSDYSDSNSVILSMPGPMNWVNPPLIEGCTFQRFSFHPGRANLAQIIYSTSGNPIRIRKCIFRENNITVSPMLEVNVIGTIDSCQFINNNAPLGILDGVPVDRDPRFEACDFVGNSNPIIVGTADSVIADNCYWGDPSGPHWSGNLTGQGQVLSPMINPSNWRTTPVFPISAIGETRHQSSVTEYALLHSYPNPTNGNVTITYSLPRPERQTRLEVIDVLGRSVSLLFDGCLTAGEHRFQWNPVRISSGTYYLRASQTTTPTKTTAIQFVK